MALRLPHVLVLMALILGAGVLSVRHLEEGVGASTVPGVVVVDAPAMDSSLAARLAARCLGGQPQWVVAPEGLLEPFGAEFAARRADEGAATALVSAGPVLDEGLRSGWRVLVTQAGAGDGAEGARRAGLAAAVFVSAQSSLRSFLLGLDLTGLAESELAAELPGVLDAVLDAADALPRTRRTAVVVLGSREPGGRRLALRIDRGAWGLHVRLALADLLEDAW